MTQHDQERSQKCSRCNQWDKVYFLHDWDGEKLCDDCYDRAVDKYMAEQEVKNESEARRQMDE